MIRILVAAAFVATVWAANEALARWGIVPVGFGLEAPAGVYFAGLGFILRDVLHEVAGRMWVVGAIVAGAALSYWLGSDVTLGGAVPLAVASGIAFLASEFCDFAVYSPLRERSLVGAVGASQVAGATVDSALFLWLAFGSLALFWGQFVGKTLMVLPVLLGLVALRTYRAGGLERREGPTG